MEIQSRSEKFHIRLLAGFGLSVSVLAFIFVSSATTIFSSIKSGQYDDSYITYRYAQNLELGNGLRFNIGDPTNSASSFLYTVLLHLIKSVSAIPIPDIGVFLGISGLALSAGVVAVHSLARSFTPFGAVAGIASAAMLVSNPSLLYWASSGMETTLFLLFMLIAISLTYFMIRNSFNSKVTVALTSVFMLGLSLIRWEGALLAILLSCYIILSPPRPFFQNSHNVWLRKASPLMFSLLAISALLAFYKLYYGHFIPDSIAFKKISNYYTQSPIEIIATFYNFMKSRLEVSFLVLTLIGSLTPWLMGLKKIDKSKFSAEVVPSLALAGSVTIVIFGAYADEFRYMAPVVGIACLNLLHLSDFPRLFKSRNSRHLNLLMICAVVLTSLITATFGIAKSKDIMNGMSYQYLQVSRVEMGQWIEKELPKNSVILSEDIGALSYFSPSMQYFDASGLTNHQLITRLQKSQKYSSIVINSSPQYMVGTTDKNSVSGSEWIFDNPGRYFDAKAIKVESECFFGDAFIKQKIRQLPSEGNFPLSVTLWKLTPKGDCKLD